LGSSTDEAKRSGFGEKHFDTASQALNAENELGYFGQANLASLPRTSNAGAARPAASTLDPGIATVPGDGAARGAFAGWGWISRRLCPATATSGLRWVMNGSSVWAAW